ncbi:MAG: N-acetyltransferase family protein [Pseudomonadota bacterium]
MTDMVFRVRDATAMDGRSLAEIHVETWRAAYAGLVPDEHLIALSVEERTHYWRELAARRKEMQVLVAESEERALVGFAAWGRTRVGQLPYRSEIYALYVHPDWQNQGAGRALMTAAFEEMAAAGHFNACLWVLSGNNSRYFYEAMGGQSIGQRLESFAGTRLEETAYAWPDLIGWLKSVKG